MNYSSTDLLESICFWLSIILPLLFLVFSLFVGGRSLFRRLTLRSFVKGFLAFPLFWILAIAGQYFLLWIIPSTRYYGFNAFLGLVVAGQTELFALALAFYAILYPIVAAVKWLRLPH